MGHEPWAKDHMQPMLQRAATSDELSSDILTLTWSLPTIKHNNNEEKTQSVPHEEEKTFFLHGEHGHTSDYLIFLDARARTLLALKIPQMKRK